MTARPVFEQELEQLNVDLIKMGAMIEEAIGHAITAFQRQDMELACAVVKNDRKINDIEKAIEARSFSLIMRQQPVARDLRTVSTALKIVTDMERIGDQAADIADLVLRLEGAHQYKVLEHLPEMARCVQQMVRDAVSAFVNTDLALAEQVARDDDRVDSLFNKVKDELVHSLRTDDAVVDHAVDLLMIAKYLERIGDHAVNIGEWVEFSETGEHKNARLL